MIWILQGFAMHQTWLSLHLEELSYEALWCIQIFHVIDAVCICQHRKRLMFSLCQPVPSPFHQYLRQKYGKHSGSLCPVHCLDAPSSEVSYQTDLSKCHVTRSLKCWKVKRVKNGSRNGHPPKSAVELWHAEALLECIMDLWTQKPIVLSAAEMVEIIYIGPSTWV